MENETATNKEMQKKQSTQYIKKFPFTEKQLYEMWRKFLSLSDGYKEFCEIMRSITDSETHTETEEFYRQFDKAYKTKHPESGQSFDYHYYSNHLSNWEFMGDVHKTDFEDWWEKFTTTITKDYSILNLKEPDAKNKVSLYKFNLKIHHKKSNKPPTPDEVIKYLTASSEYIFVAIPVTADLKTDTIKRTITTMRKNAAKASNNMKKLNECRFRHPYGEIKYVQLKDYYETHYAIHVEKKDEKEMKKVICGGDSSLFTKYKKNAKAIIKNVEKGIFPGKAYRVK